LFREASRGSQRWTLETLDRCWVWAHRKWERSVRWRGLRFFLLAQEETAGRGWFSAAAGWEEMRWTCLISDLCLVRLIIACHDVIKKCPFSCGKKPQQRRRYNLIDFIRRFIRSCQKILWTFGVPKFEKLFSFRD
jgi:hypothetical protein